MEKLRVSTAPGTRHRDRKTDLGSTGSWDLGATPPSPRHPALSGMSQNTVNRVPEPNTEPISVARAWCHPAAFSSIRGRDSWRSCASPRHPAWNSCRVPWRHRESDFSTNRGPCPWSRRASPRHQASRLEPDQLVAFVVPHGCMMPGRAGGSAWNFGVGGSLCGGSGGGARSLWRRRGEDRLGEPGDAGERRRKREKNSSPRPSPRGWGEGGRAGGARESGSVRRSNRAW